MTQTVGRKLEPASELFRVMKWGRAEGYDRVLRDQVPIKVQRVGGRYYVAADELDRLREWGAK